MRLMRGGSLTSRPTNKNPSPKQFKQVQMSTPLSDLALIFDRDHYALVVAEQRCYNKVPHTTLYLAHYLTPYLTPNLAPYIYHFLARI